MPCLFPTWSCASNVASWIYRDSVDLSWIRIKIFQNQLWFTLASRVNTVHICLILASENLSLKVKSSNSFRKRKKANQLTCWVEALVLYVSWTSLLCAHRMKHQTILSRDESQLIVVKLLFSVQHSDKYASRLQAALCFGLHANSSRKVWA